MDVRLTQDSNDFIDNPAVNIRSRRHDLASFPVS
jgi:hypothetical protein